jgi:hypothetical protein
LTSCSTLEPIFSGPRAAFHAGIGIDLEKRIPPADEATVAMGEVSLRVDSDLLDEQVGELGKGLREVSNGRLTSWKTREKAAEYRVIVREVNSQSDWEGSALGAGFGGVAGAGVGVAAGQMTGSRSSYRDAAIGGGLGRSGWLCGFRPGEDRLGVLDRCLSTDDSGRGQAASGRLENQGFSFKTGAGGGSVSVGTAGASNSQDAQFDFDSDEYPAFFTCAVTVDAGSFSGRESIEAAAMKKLLDRIPTYILGGREVTDW